MFVLDLDLVLVFVRIKIFEFVFNGRVGIEIPKIEVRYDHVSVEGDVYVGSRALPTLLNVTLNTIEVFLFLFFCFCFLEGNFKKSF